MPYIGNITQDFNVNNAMLDTDSVTSIKIVDGTIEGADIAANLDLSDSQKIRFGTGLDLEIYHNGSHSFITDGGTGNLYIDSSQLLIRNAAGSETQAVFAENGAVQLYHNNIKKLETTSSGIDVDGSVTADDIITAGALLHEGDTDTLVHFSAANTIELKTGGVSRLLVNNSGVNLQNGYFNTNGNRIILGDSSGSTDDRLVFGNNNDLEIYHDGTQSYIKNATGNLDIITGSTSIDLQGNDGSETLAKFQPNGAVELYYDNSKKFETSSTGVTVTGDLFLDNPDHAGKDILFDSSLKTLRFDDGVAAKFGTGDDLSIYHNGSNSFITDGGTGNLYISGDDTLFIQSASGEDKLKATTNGSVEIYYDNSKKFETTSTGVHVLGNLEGDNLKASNPGNNALLIQNPSNGIIGFGANSQVNQVIITAGGNLSIPSDSTRMLFGASDDLQIYHDGSNSRIHDNGTGILAISGNQIDLQSANQSESLLQAIENGAVKLRFDNTLKFETTSTGAKVSSSAGTLRIASTTDQQSATLEMTSSSGETQVGKIQYNHTNSGIVSGYLEAFLIDGTENNIAVKVDGAIKIPDVNPKDAKLLIGTGDDLQIYHDGSHSRIADVGTGHLIIQTSELDLMNAGASEDILKGHSNGNVELYYDNSKKLETTSEGVTIPTGNGLTINGGTGNRTGDAALFVDKTNNNDWTAKFKTNSGSSTDYGIRIECNSGSSFPLAINSGSDVFRVSGSGAVYATEYQGSGLTLSNVHKSYAILLEKLSDTDVGTFTSGAYRTRNLNTELEDPDGIVSLSSNQFTLQAGTYIIRWSCSAFQVDHHSTRIAHISGTVTNGGTEVGSSEYSNNGSEITNRSVGVSLQACTNANVYEIQHQCTQTINGNGFGVRTMFGADTIATIVEIFKIA